MLGSFEVALAQHLQYLQQVHLNPGRRKAVVVKLFGQLVLDDLLEDDDEGGGQVSILSWVLLDFLKVED